MAKSIFRELTFIECSLELSKTTDLLHGERQKLLEKLRAYLVSGDYSTYRNKHEFLNVMLSEYGKSGNVDRIIASRVGIAEATVRLSRTRMSDDAYSKLGRDFVGRLLNGDSQELVLLNKELDILKVNTSADSLFPYEFVELVKRFAYPPHPEFSLSECKAEAEFLKTYKLPWIRKLVVYEYDSDKFYHLLKIISNPASEDYKPLMEFLLTGDDDIGEDE
jgi:hypothetical protein